jgi:hypothetical protein
MSSSRNLSKKFAGALEQEEESKGEILSEGVVMTPGSSNALLGRAVSNTGPVAFCLDDVGLGGSVCGGLIQGSSTALGTRMCVEPVESKLGRCPVKSHDTKAPIPLQMSRDPVGLFWFLQGTAKGRQLVTLDRCWDCAVISEDVLSKVSPLPTNVGEWVLLLDGLSETGVSTSPAAVKEFAERVKGHPLAVTPRAKKVRYDNGLTPDSWESFVVVDTGPLQVDSNATAITIQRALRDTVPIVSANVDVVRTSVQGIARDFGTFAEKVGIDLDQQESLLKQLRTELGTRPPEVGASTVWQHVESINEDIDKVKLAVKASVLETKMQPILEKALEKIVMGELVEIVKPAFLFAKRYTTRNGAPAGDQLEARLHMLEQGKSLGAAPPVAPHPPRVAPNVIADVATLSEARFAMIEAQLASQAASISSLKAQSLSQENLINQLRSAMASNICEVADESFDSEVVAQAFAVDNHLATMPTCSFDVVSLLQVAHHEVADTAQAVQEGSNASKAGFKNPLQAAVASSYQIHIPTFLGGSKSASTSGMGIHPLPALKFYRSWDDNSTISQRSYVESSVKNAVKSLIATINQSSLTSRAKSLAREMIHSSANALDKLFMFMDRFYGELCNTYGTDAVEAWHLVGSIVRRFFSDLYAVRGSARYMSLFLPIGSRSGRGVLMGGPSSAANHAGICGGRISSSSFCVAGHHDSPLLPSCSYFHL